MEYEFLIPKFLEAEQIKGAQGSKRHDREDSLPVGAVHRTAL